MLEWIGCSLRIFGLGRQVVQEGRELLSKLMRKREKVAAAAKGHGHLSNQQTPGGAQGSVFVSVGGSWKPISNQRYQGGVQGLF